MKGMYTKVVMMLLSFALLAAPAQAAFVTKAAVETSNVATNAMKSAVTNSWKSMSRAERKDLRKQLKQTISSKLFGEKEVSTNLILLTIITIFVPLVGPGIAMYMHEGSFNNRALLALVLGLLGHLPGVIYNLYQFFAKK